MSTKKDRWIVRGGFERDFGHGYSGTVRRLEKGTWAWTLVGNDRALGGYMPDEKSAKLKCRRLFEALWRGK